MGPNLRHHPYLLPLLFAIQLFQPLATSSPDIGNLLRLNGEETKLLEQLKARVYPKIIEDVIKNEWNLCQFLKKEGWNLDKAELALLNYINWREENNMKDAHQEDWSEFEKEYPYNMDATDKNGQPVILADFDTWNVSKIVSTPDYTRRFFRYYNTILDEGMRKVMAMQAGGKNVSRFFILADLEKVNGPTHVDLQNSIFYWEGANHMEKFFPGMISDLMIINTPSVFQTMMPVVRYVFSEEMNKGFKDYGGKEEWKPILDNLIDPKELPPNYGGVKGIRPAMKDKLLVGTFGKNEAGKWVWAGKG